MPMKSNKTIIDDCNALARLYYKMHGYTVKSGYRFDQARHPQERLMWEMAAEAYAYIEGTDVSDALAAPNE